MKQDTQTVQPEINQTQAILSAIGDGIIASNHQGNILLINHAAGEILGKDHQKLIGQPTPQLFDVFKSEGRQQILDYLASLQKIVINNSPIPTQMQEVILEIDESVISARMTVATTSANQNLGVVIVLRDITKEVIANRLKSEFVSMVSHELRTPMTSIKGYTTLLSQGTIGELDDKQKQILNVVQRNVNRLSTLIDDLLDFSRIEAGKIRLNLRDIQLIELAQQVVETLQVSAQNKGLELALEYPPTLPTIKADWDRITQVLTNLVGNAIAYTESGSVRVILHPLPDAIQVNIKDTGIGINQADIKRIFERFYRADNDVVRANTGTGLGLPIVKSFIEMHGGRIWVDSKPNHGTTFTFLLPRETTSENV